MANDFITQMSQMYAAARPQQAAGGGPHPNVMQGGRGGGSIRDKAKGTSVNASIDFGAIQQFFNQRKEEKQKTVDQAFAVYTEMGASQDPQTPKIRDAVFSNPVLQHRLKEAYDEGDPRVTMKQMQTEEMAPTGKFTMIPDANGAMQQTPDYAPVNKTMYTFIDVPASAESQQNALMKSLPAEQKMGETLKGAEPQKILAGMYGAEARTKLLNALVAQQNAGAAGAGAKENPYLAQADKAWDELYQQYAKELDALAPDDEAGNYKNNRKLAGGLVRYVDKIKNVTGSSDYAMGAIGSWVSNADREMNKPPTKDTYTPEQSARRKNYVDLYTAILKAAKPKEIEPYATLMDWGVSTMGGENTIAMLKKQFGASDEQIAQILNASNTGEMLRAQKEAAANPPPPAPAPWYSMENVKSTGRWLAEEGGLPGSRVVADIKKGSIFQWGSKKLNERKEKKEQERLSAEEAASSVPLSLSKEQSKKLLQDLLKKEGAKNKK